MWATGAKYTDLFLWTSEEQKIVKVYPDPLIQGMIEKLEMAYFEIILPDLSKNL